MVNIPASKQVDFRAGFLVEIALVSLSDRINYESFSSKYVDLHKGSWRAICLVAPKLLVFHVNYPTRKMFVLQVHKIV